MESSIEKEQEYLDNVIKIMDEDISSFEETRDEGYEDVRQLSKYHWDTRSEMDYIEKAVTRNDVNHTASLTNTKIAILRKLKNARPNPFFGKIYVDFDGDQDSFYIGKTSVLENNFPIVNDWRSPISTLFYNSKIGNTSYKAPMGIINCNLLQREQIKIKNDKIQRIVDTDIHLTDDELQKVLSKNSDGRMRNIVATIQEEQNVIIRDLQDPIIIVQGCAGSGKTSVALHRLSFLLYNDKKSSSENMLIFSPSDAFSTYISTVLPDLGDDNVLQTTFSDFANAFVKGFDHIESYLEFLSRHHNLKDTRDKTETEITSSNEQIKMNQFKFSDEYRQALDKFIQKFVNGYRFKEDLIVNGIAISNSYLNKILDNDKTSSLQEKVNMILDEICFLLKNKLTMKKSVLRNLIIEELVRPAFDPKATYNKFLLSDEFKEAYGEIGKPINKKLLEYPDLIGLLYMNFEFMGYPKNNMIHHLVVDEVQDYSPLQMKMISKMFNGATITALGDANQTVNPYHKYDSLEEMKKELGRTAKYMELNKAYRSSPEIVEYAKEIIGDDKIEAIRKKTGNSVIIKDVDKKELFSTLVKDILDYKKQGFDRICVVTKSDKEAKAIFEGLKDSVDNLCVLCDSEDTNDKLLIAPSYNAKGLEFDAVICYNDYDNTYKEDERYLYYVVITRAQHSLTVYNEPKELKMKRG